MRPGRAATVVALLVAAGSLRGHRADAVQVCPEGLCRPLSCSGQFVGWARWQQDVSNQTDDEQDELMNQACASAHPGSRAATTQEIVDHCISGMPAENTSGDWLLGLCPDCAGRAAGWSPPPRSGHCRSCVRPTAPLPSAPPPDPSWHDFCCQSSRSAACIR